MLGVSIIYLCRDEVRMAGASRRADELCRDFDMDIRLVAGGSRLPCAPEQEASFVIMDIGRPEEAYRKRAQIDGFAGAVLVAESIAYPEGKGYVLGAFHDYVGVISEGTNLEALLRRHRVI